MRNFAPPSLTRDLLSALAAFRQPGAQGMAPHGAGLFSYCAVARERLIAVRLPHPVVAVLLSGTKEVWQGLTQERLTAGAVFVLPGGVDLEIVNDPDPRSGLYQSLILEVPPALVSHVPEDLPPPVGAHQIPLCRALMEALVHATAEIASGTAAPHVRAARIRELLALLAPEPAARPLFDLPPVDRLRRAFRASPDRAWRCAEVAASLGMSEASLRRRLRAEDTSFSALLRAERMLAAQQMLARGMASGLAAEAVGYASRTHFARAYRAVFGTAPTGARGATSDP
ncbi:helix-turn-helix transcriptional regulator [Phaeovulum sp. W22_SRMD_FR3]|uniref:helix-turn-helix transcriptional regulator n=1 Tax=Phaeovulum sp. W22_SRMD_FR3 TaxID=3240274 RepID=UPI003F9DD7CB